MSFKIQLSIHQIPIHQSFIQEAFTGCLPISLVAQTVKNPPRNAQDAGSIPGLGKSPGEGNGNPLQYSCLENPMDKGAWWATVHSVAEELDTT